MATADESSTGKSFKELSRAAWDATVTERFRLFLFIGLFIFAYSIDLLVPWAIGYTIAALVKEGFTDTAYQQALYGLAAYAGLRLLHTLFHHVGRYVQNTVAYTARMALASFNISCPAPPTSAAMTTEAHRKHARSSRCAACGP
jgi:ABC-type multidrug transport system fused ATPase/permease subunit